MITGMPRIAIAVNDFEKIVSTFADQFGMPVHDISDSSVASLGAKLGMCVPAGGSNIELMSPAIADAPLSQSLARFLDRRGEGLFALMLEAPDPNAEAERLIRQGLNVLPVMDGASGRDIHPNSTHGVLIRIYPVDSFNRQLNETGKSLGLSGIARVIIAVHDLDAATDVYGSILGLPVDAATDDRARGVRSVVCHPPSGGVIELVSVTNVSQHFARKVDDFLSTRGEGMFALMLQSPNLDGAAEALANRGLTIDATASGLEISSSDTHGAQIWIEAGEIQ
jgi:catechol 2,3-dioxygenase-like lactoylglutathione lyase family enzyme